MAHIVSRRTILLSLPAFGLARAAGAQTARKGIAVYPVATASYQQQFVAAEQGYFKDEGFDFKMLQGGSGVRAREIMAAGEADFAWRTFSIACSSTTAGDRHAPSSRPTRAPPARTS